MCIGSNCGPNSEGTLIDKKGNSVYYNPNGSAITPIPALEKVLDANKNILQNTYNYYIQAAMYDLQKFNNRGY